jgi:rare lipoprotein A
MAGEAAGSTAGRFLKFHKGFRLIPGLLAKFPAPAQTMRSGSAERFLVFACVFFCASVFAGCAGRKPVVGGAPSTPVSTPPSTEEEAKRSTSSEPQPSARTPKKSKPSDAADASVYMEEGNASWYGAPFHGRKASNGERYDMYKLTAAHRTLPFNTVVRVTNLNNGKTTTVRITDRGPFVDNRIIDLSLAAAREIESVGPGVVPVRIEVISGGDPFSGFFTVQVGAFKDRGNAERLKERLSLSYSPIFIQDVKLEEGNFYRVHVGRVSGEQQAQRLGDELRAKEGFSPMVLRLDEPNPGESTP